MGNCSDCPRLDEAENCTATVVHEVALLADDHARVSRIGNIESSRHSHRRVFERLRSLREPVLRLDEAPDPGGGLTFATVRPGSEPSKTRQAFPVSPGCPYRCSNGSVAKCEDIDRETTPVRTGYSPGQRLTPDPSPAVQGARR